MIPNELGDSRKNLEDLMLRSQDIVKTKYPTAGGGGVGSQIFLDSPLETKAKTQYSILICGN